MSCLATSGVSLDYDVHGHNSDSSLSQLEILGCDSNELPSDEWCQIGLAVSMDITEVVP